MTSSGPKIPAVLRPESSRGSEADDESGRPPYIPNMAQRALWMALAQEIPDFDKPREVSAEDWEGALAWVTAVKGGPVQCEVLQGRPHCLFAGHWITPQRQ